MFGFKWNIWILMCCVRVLKNVISCGVMVLIVNIIIWLGNLFVGLFGKWLVFNVFKVIWCKCVGCSGCFLINMC